MEAESGPRSRSIVTRTGDAGETHLLFTKRVRKDDPRVEAVGSLDELNAALGWAKTCGATPELVGKLAQVQQELVGFMGELSCHPDDRSRYAGAGYSRLTPEHLARLDCHAAEIEARQPSFQGWATPGANPLSAALELARTAARRAERRVVALSDQPLPPLAIPYLNRLSDLLWLLAREAEGPPAHNL